MVTKWYKLILNNLKQNACYLLSIDCVDMLHALDIMFK